MFINYSSEALVSVAKHTELQISSAAETDINLTETKLHTHSLVQRNSTPQLNLS
jgi:hypothetical protein